MKRLFIEHTTEAVRIAYTVDGRLKELYVDPIEGASLVGHIYVGRVQNILPGQFAFIYIGTEKNAFINLPKDAGVKKGQAVLIQIYKDAYGDKGPYGGMQLKIKGRFVIIHESPRGEIGVSHKITNPVERSRLRGAVHGVLEKGFGAVVRTQAEGVDEGEIINEVNVLTAKYHKIVEKAEFTQAPALLYPEENNPSTGLLVDLLADDLDEIWVDNLKSKYDVFKINYLLADKINYYETLEPSLFDAFNITTQITKALNKITHLPSGGFITFEQTEACVVVDVNTGSFSGQQNYHAVILQTNQEAAVAIAEQLTLRNYSGMIIIDFIDMKDRDDKQALLATLAQEIKKDRIKTEFVQMTELGLVLLTRRKTRPPLSHFLQTDCPHCKGSGHITAQKHTKNPE